MYTAVMLALLVSGLALIVFGVRAADSMASSVSNFFTGSPTDSSVWMLIGGLALIAISSLGMYRGPSRDA